MSSKPQTQSKSQQTIETKARIQKAALELFNKKGLDQVTTHDVAHRAELSPGNLYYHFKNKEQIVLQIFDSFSEEFRDLFESFAEQKSSLSFQPFMERFFMIVWKYQFFFRDFSLALRNDPSLAKAWKRSWDQTSKKMQTVAQRWIDSGDMKPFASDAAFQAFLENMFTLLYFGGIFHGATNTGSLKRNFRKVIDCILEFLSPYHTEQGLKVIRDYQARLDQK